MMNPIKFNNNDKLPKEALIPYRSKRKNTTMDKQVIAKQRELNEKRKSFSDWIIKYNSQVLESERGRNFIADIEDIEQELAALESEQPKEGTELHPVDMEQVTSAKATLTAEEK